MTQNSAKNASVPAGSAGGDLGGTFPDPQVTGLQGRPVNAAAPSDGYALVWNQADGYWYPGATGNGTAGGDLSDTYPNPKVTGVQGYSVASPNFVTDGSALSTSVPSLFSSVISLYFDPTPHLMWVGDNNNAKVHVINTGNFSLVATINISTYTAAIQKLTANSSYVFGMNPGGSGGNGNYIYVLSKSTKTLVGILAANGSVQDFAADGSGGLWVTDSGNGYISKFTAADIASSITNFPTPQSPSAGPFLSGLGPWAVCYNASGNDMWVGTLGQSPNVLYQLDLSGSTLNSYNLTGFAAFSFVSSLISYNGFIWIGTATNSILQANLATFPAGGSVIELDFGDGTGSDHLNIDPFTTTILVGDGLIGKINRVHAVASPTVASYVYLAGTLVLAVPSSNSTLWTANLQPRVDLYSDSIGSETLQHSYFGPVSLDWTPAAVKFVGSSSPLNIVGNRATLQSPTDPSQNGIVNFSSNTGSSLGATGSFATISGGDMNVASGIYSTVCGGQSNSASSDNCIVLGGVSNQANVSGAIAGGTSCVAQGQAAVALGWQCTASTGAVAIGWNNNAGAYCAAFGIGAVVSSRVGALAFSGSGNLLSGFGDSQSVESTYASKPFTSTIDNGSDTLSLPQPVIYTTNTNIPDVPGTINVTTGAGVQTVTYMGAAFVSSPTPAFAFYGCTGGTGVMSAGGTINNLGNPFYLSNIQGHEAFLEISKYYNAKIMIVANANNAAVGPAYWSYDLLSHMTSHQAIIDNQQQTITVPDPHSTGWLTSIVVDNIATTIDTPSNGQALPQSVINVVSVVGFNPGNLSKIIYVTTNAGLQAVQYTGTSGNSFTGCTGGTGTMSTGGAVIYPTPNLHIKFDPNGDTTNTPYVCADVKWIELKAFSQ